MSDRRTHGTNEGREEKYERTEGFRVLPLESSISALKAVAMPRHLLDMTVFVFVVGFGLCLLFLWVEDMSDQPIAHRNVSVLFITAIGVSIEYYTFVSSSMISNQDTKVKQFDLSKLRGSYRSAALEQLEIDLESVQQRLKTLTEQQQQRVETQTSGMRKTMFEVTKEWDDSGSVDGGA